MSKKQKNRNTNQFKKKKNKQKNQAKRKFSIMKSKIKQPPKINIKYYPETQNFKDFILKLETHFKNEKIFVEKSIIEEQDLQTILWDKKWVINETVNAKCIRYSSHLYDIGFTPFKDGIQLFKISVNPNFQRCGIGKALMCKILKIILDLNIEISLIPISYEDTIPSQKLKQFYKDLGFVKDLFSPYWIYNSKNNSIAIDENYDLVA